MKRQFLKPNYSTFAVIKLVNWFFVLTFPSYPNLIFCFYIPPYQVCLGALFLDFQAYRLLVTVCLSGHHTSMFSISFWKGRNQSNRGLFGMPTSKFISSHRLWLEAVFLFLKVLTFFGLGRNFVRDLANLLAFHLHFGMTRLDHLASHRSAKRNSSCLMSHESRKPLLNFHFYSTFRLNWQKWCAF